jgi:hypothetical protein
MTRSNEAGAPERPGFENLRAIHDRRGRRDDYGIERGSVTVTATVDAPTTVAVAEGA